ncbi:MAG: serine/threonine-protein kinase [Myxococcota bacterium]
MAGEGPNRGPDLQDAQVGVDTRELRASLQSRLFGTKRTPQTVGRFELAERLGAGAMGTVYEAFDPRLQRVVAVKVLKRDSGASQEGRLARMKREARALAQLSHANVVEVLDVGVHEGQVFIAMAHVQGTTLAEWAREQPMSNARFGRLLQLARQAAQGLAAAHRAGIVHRDVKPQNMMVGEDGRLQLLDFGLAREDGAVSQDATGSSGASNLSGTAALALTGTGQAVGTPAYMAPEQFTGDAGPLADQFSFAVSFWEAAFGDRPFPGRTVGALRLAIEDGPPKRPSDAAPAWFHRVLARALAADPAGRHRSMDAVLDALVEPGPRASMWVGGLAAVLGASAALGMAAQSAQEGTPCVEADERPAAVWTTGRRDRLSSLGDGRAVAEVDAFVGRWSTAWTSQCQAQFDARGVANDHAIRCLDTSLASLDAVLGVVASSGRDAISEASLRAALRRLDDPERCASATGSGYPEPSDPALRARINAIEAERQRLAVTRQLGALRHAGAETAAVLAQARATGHDPLIANALLLRGEFVSMESQDEAIETYAEAAVIAERSHDFDTAVEAYARKASIELMADRGEQAERSLRSAEALLPRLVGPKETLQAKLSLLRAERHLDIGEYAEAEAAVEAWMTGEDILFRIRTHAIETRAKAQLKLGRYDAAIDGLSTAVSLFRDEYGPDHPDVARAQSLLGTAAVETHDTQLAREAFEDAARIAAATLGTKHPAYAAASGNLGSVYMAQGELEKAAAAHRQALATFDASLPPGHGAQIMARVNVAELSDDAEAERLLIEAITLAESATGADGVDATSARAALGGLYLRTQRLEQARTALTRSLERHDAFGRIRRAILDRALLARTLVGLNESNAAAPLAEQSLRDAVATYGDGDVSLLEPLFAMARVDQARGDADEARAHLTRALALPLGRQHDRQRSAMQAMLAELDAA